MSNNHFTQSMSCYDFFIGQTPFMTGIVVVLIIAEFILAVCLLKRNAKFRKLIQRSFHNSHEKETKTFKDEKVNIKIDDGENKKDYLDFPEKLYTKMQISQPQEMRRYSTTKNKQTSKNESINWQFEFHDPINEPQSEQP